MDPAAASGLGLIHVDREHILDSSSDSSSTRPSDSIGKTRGLPLVNYLDYSMDESGRSRDEAHTDNETDWTEVM